MTDQPSSPAPDPPDGPGANPPDGPGAGPPDGPGGNSPEEPGNRLPDSAPEGRTARMRARLTGLTGHARSMPEQVPLVGRAIGQLLRVNLLDCATRLAAQAFLSALPALFVVAVFAPASIKSGMVTTLRKELGIEGVAQQSVQQMLAPAHDNEATIGLVGALVTLLSATALSRAMQRVCERCWELPKSGTRVAAWRWLVWLLVWLVALVFQTPVREGFGAGVWLGLPLTYLLGAGLWWWTQHLLLGARVRWLPLLPGALLCGAAVVGVGVAGRVYLPRAMTHSVGQFGPYGVVFTGLSWLIVLFTAVTLAIALGRVVAEEESVAHWLGSRTEPGVWGTGKF